uniref:centrosomal protein of 120 kDa-like isoform X1 n=1 Tax=Styela clava TaxID=7725 RepID=UPI00193A7452|nr:centrosomal protein of 120 kDa-like isoform X1 [Styela clava]
MQKEVYLVVVSILEGRNFPKRPKHQLLVECKFDGEQLSTDPIDHADTPDFTTELAWELDKKALHQHRMQRTPIKLQCYAVNTTNGVREQIGYVLLDLRLAQQNPQAPKWYNLLSSKYSRLKPAIKIGMALEDDQPTQDNTFKARDAPPRPGKVVSSAGDLEKELVAKLNEEEGYFQIGPSDNCYDMFVLSVTIAFAANLEQLIPSDKRINAAGNAGYFFYYTLLGNDVANDPFPDLLNPEFVPERASVRIRSSVNILRLYLASQSGLQVHLCSGDQSLGSAEIPLNALLKKGSKEIEIKPVITEGAFTLCPPNLMRQQLEGNVEAKVGVSISLRREEISSDSVQTPFIDDSIPPVPTKTGQQGDVLTTGHLLSSDDAAPQDVPERDVLPDKQKPKKVSKETKPKKAGETSEMPRKPLSPETEVGQRTSTPTPPLPEMKSFTLDTDDEADSIHNDSETNVKRIAKDKKEQRKVERKPVSAVSTQDPISVTESSGLTTTATHPVVPPQARHYRFSLHLKSIADLDLPFTCNAFIKYTYPFFGSAAPVLTNPPVEIPRNIQTTLPRSLCTFDFACTAPLLHNTFNSVPLIAELWHRDKESSDMLIGAVAVPLPVLMTQDPVQFISPGEGTGNVKQGKQGIRWSYSSMVHMMSVQGPNKKVADLNLALTLEDYGTVREQKLLIPQQQQKQRDQMKQNKVPQQSAASARVAVEEPRESAEYRTAMELELWKEQQEENFEHQLKEKELAHMKSLAEEWQRRDKEREAIVSKRITEYNRLETKLRKSLAEVEAREKQLSNNELELARIRTDVRREHERVLAQAKEATSRMKDDCVHQVQLERGRIKILEEENTKLKSHLVDAERKYSSLEQKFQNFKLEQNNMPEVRLQSELQLMTLEKNELERKLESVNKSKLHYKQQWGRALKELARLKQREQDHAMANLKRQQEELEQMRMKYFADEERKSDKEGQKQLLEIKEELERLKAKEASDVKRDPSTIVIGTQMTTAAEPYEPTLRMTKADEHIDEHVARLIEERDTLLRTGVYSREDRIISELDRQIRDAISRKSKA